MAYGKILAGSSSADLRETVHQSSSLILDLELDSVNGFMYWTTASSVEMSRLDGQHHHVLLRYDSFPVKICLLGPAGSYWGKGCLYAVSRMSQQIVFVPEQFYCEGSATFIERRGSNFVCSGRRAKSTEKIEP